MKLVFLPSSRSDLRWFKQYYISIFPEGKAKADKQFLALQKALKLNPYIGHSSDIAKDIKEFPVIKTPFSFIYRVKEGRIEVLRIIDTRSDYSQ